MDARNRPPQYGHPPPAPPPPPSSLHHSHPHPHTALDSRQPPPPAPPAFSPHASQPQPYPPPHPSAHPAPLYGPPPPAGTTLPPIQHQAAPGAPPSEHHQHLPPFRHPSYGDPANPNPEYHAYHAHNHSGHVTPAPAARSFSVDSAHQQRTPTTPAQPAQYPTATAPDGSTPHHPMDHSAHYGYPTTNGVSAHGMHVQPPPHEQSHAYATPVMENHHAYPPPPSQTMAYSQGYGPVTANIMSVQKRKQMRATQACEQCRQRKQKCDEGNPCSFCKEQNLTCQYRDTPPAKTDKNMERVLQSLDSIAPVLDNISAKMDEMDHRLQRLEHVGRFQASNHDQSEGPEVPDEPIPPPKRNQAVDDHRTAPHKLLLLWPSVRNLLKHAQVHHGESYVIEAEDRGVLRIYTRGEGIDEADGTHPGGPASPARSEDSSDASMPSPPEGLWGTGLSNTPGSDARRAELLCEGGLKPDGSLDLDMATINKLYDSYMKTFHRMHPFLDKSRLRKLFDRFINRYSTGNPTLRKFAVDSGSDQERPMKRQRSNGATAVGIPGSDPMSSRREPTERSPGNAIVWLVLALGKICLHKGPLPGAVPDNKLTANQVVSHQASASNGITGSSPIPGVKPSPTSPKATPFTQPTPPGAEGYPRPDMRSRRSSIDAFPGARNLDIIPGLAYYAKAAEILGDQGDGNDLVHAQMFLLAGLYKGQLARVKESMSWITMAGRAIIMLLDRYKLYNEQYWTAYGDAKKQYLKGQARIKDKRHSLIVLASWTCLQLESDILAELRLPQSGILSIEEMLLLPLNMPDDDKDTYEGLFRHTSQQQTNDQEDDERLLIYYSAQLYLRRRLNRMHMEMYSDRCLHHSVPEVREMLVGHEETLGNWREQLPTMSRHMAWDNSDRPPPDILDARLRAKYWGARYVANRPFLDYALHIMPQIKEGRSLESVAVDAYGNPRDKAEVHLFRAISTMKEEDVFAAVQKCIEAAMQSTIAFDGIEDRLVVTNIHGTAHAQFGNMLVLSATYNNPWLKELVDPDRYKTLLVRTIAFLRKLSQISPTCGHDCIILEKISKLVFGGADGQKSVYRNEGIEPGSATTSFSHSS